MKTIEYLKSYINGVDDSGNIYNLKSDGSLILKIKGEDRYRNIGRIFYRDDSIAWMKSEKESERFRVTDSWSVPYYLFNLVDLIYFKTEKDTYKIEVKNIKIDNETVFVKHFNNSTERKVYIPVNMWIKKSEVSMKYVFRGNIIFEYIPDRSQNKVIQRKIHNLIPAFDYCIFINEDYKLLSEFFDKVYRHTQGEDVELKDIEVN